ncbi:serine phosphatase [Thermosinus carboxydivorans Nor1]|uniref:Serine phosphatase n=1 Tax=Thermosinus carboxydivorans Nor1 TaxID=401526 RepID=A1HT69_9FIRM|nr:SpoIIE family protein phosphatase [Thermosinus carboxydivorans]EAX46748.1 serine phosphatase [Thermosinus carboxydivorans Nor1]
MYPLHAEVGVAQLSKTGEELCGDKVEVLRTPTDTIIVLSDGLGSGVKANILATLTTKIASSMLKRGIPLEDVVDTIAKTLPVCRQRKIAYSTLHIIKVAADGLTTIVEFDCPSTFLLRAGKVVPFPTTEKIVGGKVIKEGQLYLQENDIIVGVSDGVIHAGIGGLLKLGWGWQGIASELVGDSVAMTAENISRKIMACCEGYYAGHPGDDSTVVAVKIRQPVHATLLTGPPADPRSDEKVVKRFLSQPGKKIIAGGTTANIVSRLTGKPLIVALDYHDPAIPPTGRIEGIDLVTEGVLTLNAAVEKLKNPAALAHNGQDGATRLAKLLLSCDKIDIFAGGAINPAHQNPNFPAYINIKAQVLSKLQSVLESMGKQVSIEWF